MNPIILRDYQVEAENAIRHEYVMGLRAPLLVMPTGSGKTVLFVSIAQRAAAKGKRILILVHRKELLAQTSATLRSFGVAHGLIAAGVAFADRPVQVASVQTLIRRVGKLSWRPDLIVVDEAHHATGKTSWGKVLHHYGAGPGDDHCRVHVLGVTATPERLDGQGLGLSAGGFFDALVRGPSVIDLIGRGHLSPPVVYAPSRIDLSGVHTRAGDYARDELAERMDKPSITGDAVAHYRKHCPSEPALAFCVSVAHAEHVAASFRAAGIAAAGIDGSLDESTRASRIRDLANGSIKVLTSCEIVSEGTDIPVVSAAILLRPTQSLGLYLQQVGRVLRPFPGKKRAIVLDHVGNCLHHGLPDDDREWTLEGAKRTGKRRTDGQSLPIRQCEKCYYVHRPAPNCPKCGFIYPVRAREIETVPGELNQVDPNEVRRIARREQAKAKTLEDLREIGRQRGYKPGWAEYVWKARERRRAA